MQFKKQMGHKNCKNEIDTLQSTAALSDEQELIVILRLLEEILHKEEK